jgi:hypothetical protein
MKDKATERRGEFHAYPISYAGKLLIGGLAKAGAMV